MTAYEQIYASLAKSLLDDIVNTSDPSSERAVDILAALQKESNLKPMTVAILRNTKIGKYLTKTAKACKRHKRTASSNGKDDWDEAIQTAEALLSDFKDAADVDQAKQPSPLKKKKAEKDAASKNMMNGQSADSSVAAEGATAKQPPASKARPKRTDAMKFKSGQSTANGKVKQSSALKMKSERVNAKDAHSSESTTTKLKISKKSSALEHETEVEDDTLEMSMTKSNHLNSRESTENGKSKLSFLSKLNTESEEDAPSKEVNTSDCDNGELNEQQDKFFQPCDKTPIRSSGSPKKQFTPPSLYKVCQRVYAKDDATGLLYPAFIRKIMWGPTSTQVNIGFCSSLTDDEPIDVLDRKEKAEEEEDEDEDARRWDPRRNCYHYYVHYMGWNVKWDRWVEESFLYEDSASTKGLAKLLTKEYSKVKPKKKGQKMTVVQIRNWMNRMMELEAEHRRSEREGNLGGKEENVDGDNLSKVEMVKMTENGHAASKGMKSNETMNRHVTGGSARMEEAEVKGKDRKTEPNKPLNEETLQKQTQLRKTGLQMKRKRSVSDRLTLPFNLKKVLVEEWEVITQCDMVHNLPSQVSVRESLNRYLENKLAPLREKEEKEGSSGGKMAAAKVEGDKMQKDDASPETKKKKCTVLGKEWIDMVENIALFFDQCLSAHLLFAEERSQYHSLRRQILAQNRNSAAKAASVILDGVSKSTVQGKKSVENMGTLLESSEKQPCDIQSATTAADSSVVTASESSVSSNNLKSPPYNFLPGRMSEIYGCEHLLRLFVRLPAIVAASPVISEMESRRIFSKLGDLVRYLQKYQSQLFCSSFRRPLAGENRGGGGKKVGGK